MLSLMLAGTFAFSGGSAADLAKALSAATSQPVAILAMPKPKVLPCQFGWQTPMDAKTEVRHAYGFAVTQDAALGFGAKAWPVSMLGSPASGAKGLVYGGSIQVDDGKIVAKPEPDRYLTIDQVAHASLSKPLHVHWLLAKAPITLSADHADELQTIEAVADAVRGKLTVTDSGYDLEPDPDALRDGVAGAYDALAAADTDPAKQVRWQTAADAIRQLSKQDAMDLYAQVGVTKVIEAQSGSAAFVDAWNVARAEVGSQMADSPSGKADPRRAQSLRRSIDPQQPVQVELNSNGTVLLRFRDRNGNPRFPM